MSTMANRDWSDVLLRSMLPARKPEYPQVNEILAILPWAAGLIAAAAAVKIGGPGR